MAVILLAKGLTTLTGEDGDSCNYLARTRTGTLGMTRGNGDQMESEMGTEVHRMNTCCRTYILCKRAFFNVQMFCLLDFST